MIRWKHLGLVVLATGLAGLAMWIYGFPWGFQACGSSPNRDLYVDYLTEQGYSVVCGKEQGIEDFFKFRMQTWRQFLDWAETHQISRIYEQPGYFWFLTPAGSLGAEGFVFYEYK